MIVCIIIPYRLKCLSFIDLNVAINILHFSEYLILIFFNQMQSLRINYLRRNELDRFVSATYSSLFLQSRNQILPFPGRRYPPSSVLIMLSTKNRQYQNGESDSGFPLVSLATSFPPSLSLCLSPFLYPSLSVSLIPTSSDPSSWQRPSPSSDLARSNPFSFPRNHIGIISMQSPAGRPRRFDDSMECRSREIRFGSFNLLDFFDFLVG